MQLDILKIELSLHGHMGPSENYELDLRCGQMMGQVIDYYQVLSEQQKEVTLSASQLQQVQQKLVRLEIETWDAHYLNEAVIDGTQWDCDVAYADGTTVTITGSNDYPPQFMMLVKIFKPVGAHTHF